MYAGYLIFEHFRYRNNSMPGGTIHSRRQVSARKR
jgi:hypothetical protein